MALVESGYCEKHKALHQRGQTDRRSAEAVEWRRLYHTDKWKKESALHLLKNPFCVECAKHGERVRATEVDHIIPHKGDVKLFFDRKNWQGLCHRCHARKTAMERYNAEFAEEQRESFISSDER